jgi:hypothetical protein
VTKGIQEQEAHLVYKGQLDLKVHKAQLVKMALKVFKAYRVFKA